MKGVNRMNPKCEREQTTIRLPVELKEELQKQAAEMGMSFNSYFLGALIAVRNNQEILGRLSLQILRCERL